MQVILEENLLTLVPESDAEASLLGEWKLDRDEHVFVCGMEGTGMSFRDLGHRDHVRQEPLNVVSSSPDPRVQLISNFARTPFEIDGAAYASVESFWQGLKFLEPGERRRVAQLDGNQARSVGQAAPYGEVIEFDGREVRVGTRGHWDLMLRACRSKFTQHSAARQALLDTGSRPLVHRVRHDSKAIPGVVMASIWMQIREELHGQQGTKVSTF